MKSKTAKIIYLLVGLAMLVGFWMLAETSDSLSNGINEIRRAKIEWLALGLAAVFCTFVASALAISSLAFKKIRYKRTLLVQIASGFATKLVPAGIGGAALNIRYLNIHKHTLVESGSVMAVNNLLGFVGHFLIITCVILFGSASALNLKIDVPFWLPAAVLSLLVLFLIAIQLSKFLRLKILKVRKELIKSLKIYRKKPLKLAKGLIFATCVTAFFAAALYCSARALGISLPPLELLWVLSLGIGGAAVTPTPGGLGGAEAAIVAALMALGLSLDQALPIALTYRLLSYWLPILPGALAFQHIVRRGYI